VEWRLNTSPRGKIHGLFWFKAFHLIGIVVWFAGLFYLVRLLSITLRRMNSQNQPARFSRISINYGKHNITTPGMVVTVAMAIGLLTTEPEVQDSWLLLSLF